MIKDTNNISHKFSVIESLEEREDTNENKLSFNSKYNVFANDSKNSLSIQKKKKKIKFVNLFKIKFIQVIKQKMNQLMMMKMMKIYLKKR